LLLLPRMVAAGNVSRVGLAEVVLTDGVPTGVTRLGVALAPDEGWERAPNHAGVEDPRSTWIEALGLHVMSYVAYGPLGPKPALAVSRDLHEWRRLGALHFEYDPALDTDLNLYPNKDVVFFPEPVTGLDGRPAYAMLHRPMWDLGWIVAGQGNLLPRGLGDERPGIWISYAPADAVDRDISALVHQQHSRLVALPEYDYEQVKIGAGPHPVRVDEGWLLIHHGVSGTLEPGWQAQQNVTYAAGAMILDASDPSRVLARTAQPLLAPELDAELQGTVANVVFPTFIADVDHTRYVFYGMADARIGVARLDREP
jgi:beta-1,2-mannobiose phosphorylase / 1,2-beta-oligomannan phosphorylase